MDEVTDVVFREILRKASKPDVFFTEFTSVDGLASVGRDRVIQKLRYNQNQRPIVAQIWGHRPENFWKAAKTVSELGFDGVDINMGCPDRTVVKNNGGSALINQKETVTEIVKAIRDAAPNLPVSIKTRLDTTDALTNEWIEFVLSLKVEAFTLHARTAKAMSTGFADWSKVKEAVNIRSGLGVETVIIGNGDATSYKDVVQKSNTFNCEGVMIGRGVFQNPWVFEKHDVNEVCPSHSLHEHLLLLAEHMRMFHETWGTLKNFEIMKKFVKVYVKNFDGADILRKEFMACRTYQEAKLVIDKALLDY